jgi:N-glycosidase YbiA
MKETSPINIIEEIWQYLSPFSAHQIEIWGEKFATVEHAYQTMKFLPGKEQDEIRNAPSAYASWKLNWKYKGDQSILNPNFDREKVMEELLRAKVAQHPEILEILKASGTRCLLKNVEGDEFWGVGRDGSGQNKMGKLWMKIREELR